MISFCHAAVLSIFTFRNLPWSSRWKFSFSFNRSKVCAQNVQKEGYWFLRACLGPSCDVQASPPPLLLLSRAEATSSPLSAHREKNGFLDKQSDDSSAPGARGSPKAHQSLDRLTRTVTRIFVNNRQKETGRCQLPRHCKITCLVAKVTPFAIAI